MCQEQQPWGYVFPHNLPADTIFTSGDELKLIQRWRRSFIIALWILCPLGKFRWLHGVKLNYTHYLLPGPKIMENAQAASPVGMSPFAQTRCNAFIFTMQNSRTLGNMQQVVSITFTLTQWLNFLLFCLQVQWLHKHLE